MIPLRPLIIEHRLIERVVALLPKESKRMRERGHIDPILIDTLVDFIRMYTARTHQGKEENILFKALAAKDLSEKDQRTMRELISDHRYERDLVKELVAAKKRYLQGNKEALAAVAEKMVALATLYPEHIGKEETVFFPAAMEYLSPDEQDTILQQMRDFDRRLIHEKYKSIAEEMESVFP